MPNDETPVQDPLKPLDRITETDPRYANSPWTLETLHAEIDGIRLHGDVSPFVRQLFETTKTLALFAWYYYRFHTAAEVMASIVLERALRERAARERCIDIKEIRATLGSLMREAVDKGWIRSEGFSVAYCIARAQLHEEQVRDLLKNSSGEQDVPIPDIDEASILRRASELDYAKRLVESTPFIRNEFAHGNLVLHGSSLAKLRLVAEAVSQLFAVAPQPDASA